MGTIFPSENPAYFIFPVLGTLLLFVGISIRKFRANKGRYNGRSIGHIIAWQKREGIDDDRYHPLIEFDYQNKKFQFVGILGRHEIPEIEVSATPVRVHFNLNDPRKAVLDDPKANSQEEMYETISLASGALCLGLGFFLIGL